MDSIQKFQELLRKLFEFEVSDLDFGIYRILNYKRERIEKFIQKDLVNKVESANMVVKMREETKLAKEIIKQEIKKAGYNVLKIILFGSRAKDKAKKDSDWDFLVVINKEISPKIEREITSNLRTKLVFSGIPADIILISEKNFKKQLNDVGYITYYAVKEGIEI